MFRKKPSKKMLEISEAVMKKKFTFKKRGQLTEEEMKEIRKTHTNIFERVRKEKEKVEADGMVCTAPGQEICTVMETGDVGSCFQDWGFP